MKKIFLLAMIIALMNSAFGQLDLPPSGGNPRATLTETVGITHITLGYSRPDVNGREGKVWGDGKVVTYGFSTSSFITNKNTSPWRAGANENTTITFQHDVKVEGHDLKAGTYGLFMAIWPDSATIVFSNKSDAWGSFYYEDRYDALRVTVKPVMLDKSVEYLKYEFTEHKDKSCVIAMMWEHLEVPFRVDVDVDNIVLATIREQVTGQKGFNQLNMMAAANYCLNKNINLDEALVWAQRAAALKTFATLSTLGTAYTKLNRLKEADSTMNEALVLANPNQYLGYGRALITGKRMDRAMEIMKSNQQKNGDSYTVNSGYMFYYSAVGDYKKSLDYANKALVQAPNDGAKTNVTGYIAKLQTGKDVN
jgi:hypothetical protein